MEQQREQTEQEKQMQQYINQVAEQVHVSYEPITQSLIRQIAVLNMQLQEAGTSVQKLNEKIKELEEQDSGHGVEDVSPDYDAHLVDGEHGYTEPMTEVDPEQ